MTEECEQLKVLLHEANLKIITLEAGAVETKDEPPAEAEPAKED